MSDPVSKKGDDTIQRIQKQLIANIWLNVAAIIFGGFAISFAYFVYFEETEIQHDIALLNQYQTNVLTDLEEDLDILVKIHNGTAFDTIINNGTHVIYENNGHTVELPLEVLAKQHNLDTELGS